MTTISDVASRAGVSNATVSRVLNANYPVAEETRQRVLAAVRDLGYVVNAHARALTAASTGTVGIVVHDVSDPYFAQIVRGAQEVADAHERLLIICNSTRNPTREMSYVEMLRSHRVDAVVLAGGYIEDDDFLLELDHQARQLRAQGAGLVLCGHHAVRADAVVPDNAGGAYHVTSELLRAGHTRIAHLAGPGGFSTSLHRLHGYHRALESSGIAPHSELESAGDFTRDGGYDACVRLLESGVDFTGVFAANDMMAVGALAALREAGRAVPDDVSLVGFGDIPISRDLTPPLTTVRVPLVEMGRRAMELALAPAESDRVHRLASEVVARESVAPLASRALA